MKKYVFIITDCSRSSLHVGLSADLMQTVQFYRGMPNLFFDADRQPGRLVYFEEYYSEDTALNRFEIISHFTRLQKERLIREVNADWIDLTMGLQYEQEINTGFPKNYSAARDGKKTLLTKRQAA